MKKYLKHLLFILILLLIIVGVSYKNAEVEYVEYSKTEITKEDIVTDYYEDDMTVECTITNKSKRNAKRVEVVYYVYNDKNDLVYIISDIFSLRAGESKYTDLSFCDDYGYTEIKVFDVY